MWPNIIKRAKQGGLNTIQTYVFWNVHEPEQGKVIFKDYKTKENNDMKIFIMHCLEGSFFLLKQFNFSGRADLVKFIKLIEKNGMYVTLRLGPFIQAEWTHGYVYMLCYLILYKFTMILVFWVLMWHVSWLWLWWNIRGLPYWLREVPGIFFRTDNEPFKVISLYMCMYDMCMIMK